MCVSRWFLALLLLLVVTGARAQDSLLVTDQQGEPLPYATVEFLSGDQRVAEGFTDFGGKIAVAPGSRRVRINYTGFRPYALSIDKLAHEQYTVALTPTETMLIGPTVIGRRNEALITLSQRVETIGRGEIARAQSLTTADALADLSGVYVQKSQFGGGSPVVRGFEANRVLLVVDGVRMNNAIFRNGHLQNAISVDPLALERIELLYGAGALAYGSDALGGVVHFRTQQPQFRPRSQGAVDGKLAVRVGSAAQSMVVGAKLGYGGERWAGLTIASSSVTSHLRSGAQRPAAFPEFGLRPNYVERTNGVDLIRPNRNPNVQVGTAYNQYNLLQKLRFRPRAWLELKANFQLTTTSDVPRYDALTERRNGDLRWARWDYGPQTRALASLGMSDTRGTRLYDRADYLVAYQFTAEDRITRRFGDPLEENNLVDVHTFNVHADFRKQLGSRTTLRYGLDARYDAVGSSAFLLNLTSGERSTDVPTRYPSGGSWLAAVGGYAEARYRLGDDWALRGGFRLTRQRLMAIFGADDPVDWPTAYLTGVSNVESAATFTLGLRQRSGWRFLYAEGFRAPNIDDFAKFRERNGFVQIPNPALQPERSHTLEAGYRWEMNGERAGRFTAELTAYHTWLRGAIVRRPGSLPDGRDFFVSRGDTLRAQTNANAEDARVYGADLVLRYVFTPSLTVATRAHYLRGRRRQIAPDGNRLTLPQDHIPPPYGSTTITYEKARWTADLRLRYQLAKRPEDYAVGEIILTPAGYVFDRTGTADNFELTPVTEGGTFAGTYGWWTLNLGLEYALTDWSFRLRAGNLLDRHYRTFASGVSAPGIDVGLGVEWSF